MKSIEAKTLKYLKCLTFAIVMPNTTASGDSRVLGRVVTAEARRNWGARTWR
jgi:hypothetical protein